MELDLDWIAVYGAVLSTILAAAGFVRWVITRPKERENKVIAILESVYASIWTADEYFGEEALHRLANNLRRHRDKIIGLDPTLRKTVPEIARHLSELIELMDNAKPGLEAVFLERNDNTKPLIAALQKEIEKWLSDHA